MVLEWHNWECKANVLLSLVAITKGHLKKDELSLEIDIDDLRFFYNSRVSLMKYKILVKHVFPIVFKEIQEEMYINRCRYQGYY